MAPILFQHKWKATPGWSYKIVLQDLNIDLFAKFLAVSPLETPMTGITDVDNRDEECFLWCGTCWSGDRKVRLHCRRLEATKPSHAPIRIRTTRAGFLLTRISSFSFSHSFSHITLVVSSGITWFRLVWTSQNTGMSFRYKGQGC